MKSWILGFLALALVLPLGAAPLSAGPNEAFVLLHNASVYKEKGLGTVEWADTLTLGDKVTLLGGLVKMKIEGKERELFKVKLPNGKEGYVRATMLGAGGVLSVVKNEGAFVYSEPRDVKITDRTLSRGQIVVVLKDGTSGTFCKVVGYDARKDTTITDAFVALDDLTLNDVDANAIILLTVAKTQKNETIKKNLLNLALSKYSATLFADLVQAQLGTTPRAVKPATGTFVVNDANVNLRDQPNEVGSKVVGTVAQGESVVVTEVTTTSYTVAGATAPWYHVQSPDGWVFGAFLTPAP